MKIILKNNIKLCRSDNYNYLFDTRTGHLLRWGEDLNDDPIFAPFGPELVDIEISTICSGVYSKGVCKFCYKSNTPDGSYMTFDIFKQIFDKLPKTVTQIAFGIGNISGNPDMWSIFQYCRDNNVIPNITINGQGINDTIAKKFASVMGAVAVSIYDRDLSYDAIRLLTANKLKYVNIHLLLAEETLDRVWTVLRDIKTDVRLAKLNAVVFLGLKNKGRAKNSSFHQLNQTDFDKIVDFCSNEKYSFGFDSCSTVKFMNIPFSRYSLDLELTSLVEFCESTRFSAYINVDGKFFPCSFIEGEKTVVGDWTEGLDVMNCNDFLNDVWFNEKTISFRNECNKISAASCSGCLHYQI